MRGYHLLLHAILVYILFSGFTQIAVANPICAQVFLIDEHSTQMSPTLRNWLKWETSSTVPGWDQEREQSPLPITFVNANTLKVEILSEEDVVGLDSVLKASVNDKIPWFQHPYNQDKVVPNSQLKPQKYGVAYHTASRTIVSEINGRPVAIKMPTDHPFGPNRWFQFNKVRMDKDLKYSVARSKVIKFIDEKIGADQALGVQKEIAAVVDIKTGNGYLFRDLSSFRDGYHYLPAHLIPTVGKELAAKIGKSTIEYWKQHWAKLVGEIQAKLLFRYGIEVRAVNPQNFVIELDNDLIPTGVILWRDLAESHLVEPIAARIGLQEYIDRDKQNGDWGVHQNTEIKNTFLSWKFENSNSDFSSEVPDEWAEAHDQGFRDSIESELGIKIPQSLSVNQYVVDQLKNGDGSEFIKAILFWHRSHQQNP